MADGGPGAAVLIDVIPAPAGSHECDAVGCLARLATGRRIG